MRWNYYLLWIKNGKKQLIYIIVLRQEKEESNNETGRSQ